MFLSKFLLKKLKSIIFLFCCFFTQVFNAPYFLQTEKGLLKQFTEEFFLKKEDQNKKGLDLNLSSTVSTEKSVSFEIDSPSGFKIPVTFYDRNSTKLVLLGQCFGTTKEIKIPLAEKLKSYDVVLFDFRWKDMGNFISKFSTIWAPTKKLVFDEKEEIVTVVNNFKNKKKYEQVVGLGESYGAFTFILAQADEQKKGKKLFDKLILDSCWFSLDAFLKQVLLDPWLMTNPQRGGVPKELKKIYKNTGVHWLVCMLFGQVVPHVCIRNSLSQLKNMPLLFIHSINDKLVLLHGDFDRIWKAASKTNKVAVLTPFLHVENSNKVPFYDKLCEQFIESKNVDEFVSKFVS